jgi:hypothetical protein
MNAPHDLIDIAGRLRIGDDLALFDRHELALAAARLRDGGEIDERLRIALAEIVADAAREHDGVGIDRQKLRRDVLNRLKRTIGFGLSTTAAAHLIAEIWAAYRPGDEPPAFGTPEALFDRLDRAGCRPLKWRQIFDEINSGARW